MKRFFQFHFLKPPHTTTSTTTITTPTTLSPLDIPHLLDLIFSFLDDYTIRYTVVFVCRIWFQIYQNRIYRTVAFHDMRDYQNLDRLLPRLLGARRLECFLEWDSFFQDDTNTIRALLARYHEGYQKQLKQRNRIPNDKRQPTLYSFSPLRELRIQVAVQYETTIDSIPFPPSLTSLELVFINSQTVPEDLGKMMRRCPLLEHLFVTAEQRPGRDLLWTTLKQDNQAPLPLRSFTLRNISFSQVNLENLLSFTPRLKSLELLAMDSCSIPDYNWTRLLDHLRALGIILDSVHFSEYGLQTHLEITPRLIEICPTTSTWILWAPEVSPSSLQALTLRTSFLTTLELHWKPREEEGHPLCCSNELSDAPRLLQDLLCTSPLLVHLKSLKTVVWPEHMDLHDRGRSGTAAVTSQEPWTPPSIWVCRGLERLDIAAHGLFNSRNLYGYISRVLPQLVELFISTPEACQPGLNDPMVWPGIGVQLEGGFSLLSRLAYLKRLWIRTDSYEYVVGQHTSEMELNWMTPSGRKDKFKQMRRGEVEQWREKREQESQREASQPPQQPSTIARASDTEIWHQLRHLGLLLDVEEMIKEIDTNESFVPFPSLQRVSFQCRTFLSPEELLRSMFPSKKKGLWDMFKRK